MKNKMLFFTVVLSFCAFTTKMNAQSWTTGNNLIYINPSTTNVGIGTSQPTELLHVNNGALKIGQSVSASARSTNVLKFGDGDYVTIGEFEADDELSFKASKYNFTNGNLGIGVTNPLYKLDVNGKMFLRCVEVDPANYTRSYLHWASNKLIMGTPAGYYMHNSLDLMPGGSDEGTLFSQIVMYTAYSPTNIEPKIKFCTTESCWINTTNNFGLGTSNPQYKLDVRGTIRATEIIVNTPTGADFVFDKDYYLRPLSEVQSYIHDNQHLPDIPSAKEMIENGVSMSELQIQLLQKVEELTLYILQQEQRIHELESLLIK